MSNPHVSNAVAAACAVFVVLAASYDLLLGYTGVVSFAHTLFFCLGRHRLRPPAAGWGAGRGRRPRRGARARSSPARRTRTCC